LRNEDALYVERMKMLYMSTVKIFGNEEHFLSRKWLNVSEELAYKKIINCTNALEIRNIGNYLLKIRCKWENKIINL
jgi:hypothetical protein